MTVLVTGTAGFIGMHVAAALLARGETVIGVDSLTDYYSVALKEARLASLTGRRGFSFERLDLAQPEALLRVARAHPEIDRVVHLAAQPGVRYSVDHPRAYVSANLVAQLEVLEACRHLPKLKHLVFASSSSVYGGNTKLPFAIDDRVDQPRSLYAATKKADELMSYCYAHLYQLPSTGLRFFTVYGPWGRPDMAPWLFTEAILAGKPIKLFNHGKMRRDFTYIDDIVAGVLACLDQPPPCEAEAAYRLYNIGNSHSEELERFVAILEQAIGRKAAVERVAMPPGDIEATYADITETTRDFGFVPRTALAEGLPRFVAWYRAYHKL
ncbi:MAG TPA: NAD-dependent epimerase/dehydratase family protein [Stellaceae bacterium]|jgi:UDP-glucuronate 4-epimerase|nr:NAD-dependent epimerase/dehydratase family protein [Stellaceae bacterium]